MRAIFKAIIDFVWPAVHGMSTRLFLPFNSDNGENTNGNIALAAPCFDEDKLLIYREIFFDNFSTVIAARDLTTGGAVAIKRTNYAHLKNIFGPVKYLRKRVTRKLRRQTMYIRSLSHPALMKILDFVAEPTRVIVITEMCMFGDLFNWMLQQNVIRFRDVLIILQGLFQAFQFLHEKGYSHGYLKPTNILFQTISPHSLIILPELSVKRETSILINDPLLTCHSCTAPEALAKLIGKFSEDPWIETNSKDTYDTFGTKAMDIWSIGVIALIALTGKNYFAYNTIEDLQKPISPRLEEAFSHPIMKLCSKQLVARLRSVLCVDPDTRLTATEAAKINWVGEAKVADDDKNLLYLMEYDLQDTCRYFRSYGHAVIEKLLEISQPPTKNSTD